MASPGFLVGLDFGTTTSSAIVAEGIVRRAAVSGRMELSVARELWRSPLTFTPLHGDSLDLAATVALVDDWLARGGIAPGSSAILGGGALLTGLTARRDNAAGLVAAIRARLGPALVATADDPCLESWLAFQGSCAALSRRHPGKTFLHLDIGGGTTNLAYGRDGEVLSTGCLFVGARHVRFLPGTRRIEWISPHAVAVLRALSIAAAPGDDLAEADVDRLLDWYLALLGRAVAGGIDLSDPASLGHVQVPFPAPQRGLVPVLTLSGGVGEMVYAAARGGLPGGITPWGDLGVDLALRLLRHPDWGTMWVDFVPEAGGRATVAGLLRHATRVSGASIHLPRPGLLPLSDLPIVGTLRADRDDDDAIRPLLDLARRSPCGAAIRTTRLAATAAAVAAFGTRLAGLLAGFDWPADRALVLLLDGDCGKAVGQCATRWGRLDLPLVAVDQLDLPDARWVTLGSPRDGVVPVSFHGLVG